MRIIILSCVDDFIQSLEESTISKVLHFIRLLEQFGSLLRMPYAKKIDNNIFELRIHGKQEVRIFYMFRLGEAILFYGMRKKTQKLLKKELKVIQLRFRDLDGI